MGARQLFFMQLEKGFFKLFFSVFFPPSIAPRGTLISTPRGACSAG